MDHAHPVLAGPPELLGSPGPLDHVFVLSIIDLSLRYLVAYETHCRSSICVRLEYHLRRVAGSTITTSSPPVHSPTRSVCAFLR